jgi:HAD superfamily hydrolase (TIGR01509 family)
MTSNYDNTNSTSTFIQIKNEIDSYNPEVKALIFDCDGTLVDSMPLHMIAWEKAFAQFGEYFDRDLLFSLKGMKETEIIDVYNSKYRSSINNNKIVLAKHNYFMQHIESVKPIEPIVEIAKSYFNKIPLAVVSGSVKIIVLAELNVLKIFQLFDFILTADDPFKPKPSPDIFIAAANMMKLKPEFCLVLEDGDAGLEAASKAGMKMIDIRNYIKPE